MTTARKVNKKTPWPAGIPVPSFETEAEETAFWERHDFGSGENSDWEELVYEPQATRRPRSLVYRVRLDASEMAALQVLSKKRGVPGSVVVRDLVQRAYDAAVERKEEPAKRRAQHRK
jgi:hypothetical protein